VVLGPSPPPLAQASNRTWAVSPDATMLAVGEAGADGVRLDVMRLDGSGRRTVWSDAPDRWPAALRWSPDSQRLLFVSSQRRLEGGRLLEQPQEAVVVDLAGRVLLRWPIGDFDVRWLGSDAVYIAESGTNAPSPRPSAVIGIASGAESPGLPTRGLLCFSPDGRYAVYANTPSGRTAGHRVVAVATGEVVLESQTRTEVGFCDWTPDSTRVVLSFGGK
jgi:dipeptidyl aminopeptidase/acylaminoacyl peptidase